MGCYTSSFKIVLIAMQIASCDTVTENWKGNSLIWLISSVDNVYL